ncbi:alkylation response protein AidB-like acyl-CoA dehydrogenase [Nocardioides salarius]|uniref:Alkylation response protein AidB-like acyl-CoA dehydrogenase n=1 Tax=Nocardioides salarius TaxID=374513 RepID=A0ABS2MGN8_9ACTN|nr:acyl-CoA dehydrogenase family protein [Nocardioides salarius]MBM7510346.1 alkylation response protein AidB-like acyl-CoA dehydrogenase [Nocardioides salarius]
MSIGISAEHTELAASLRSWAGVLGGPGLARAAEGDATAGFAEAWEALVEMGVPAIAVAEEHGGGGGGPLDVAVALEACAHELVPGPLLGPVVAAHLAPGQAIGDGVVSLVLDDLAWDAPCADRLLVVDDDGLLLLDRGAVQAEQVTGLDLSRRFGRVTAVDRSSGVRVVGADAGDLRRAAVTYGAAEAAGLARWCLGTAVSYAGVREQFGRPIGSFQAVKHLCAEMLENAEAVTAAAWDVAAAAADGDREQWDFAVDVAAVTCFDGAVDVAKSCIQVLGGIGFTFEHDAHLYLRRALALRGLLGRRDEAAQRLVAATVAGRRRRVRLDLQGRDDTVRPAVRDDVAAVAALPVGRRREALVRGGLLTPHWPAPYGRGAGAVEQVVIDEELARAGIERPDIVIAGWALPTIVQHGSDEQRERFVLPSLRGEIVWCQLFSEPGAGSDLASLRTRAVRVDGGWRLSGQKVWTSLADRADWAICLARTDPDVPQHRGITYFLVDMRASEGIEVRPLREITGEALFNEVFLDDVFVPDDCVVAQPGDGWRLARTTLANERVAMAGSRLTTSTERAVELAGAGGLETGERIAVGRTVALSTVCMLLGVRSTLRSLDGQGPGPESSVAKLLGVRNRQDAAELVVDLQRAAVAAYRPDASGERLAEDVREMLNTRCLSIAGGTTQVLRNVAGERILGLPR